MFLDLALSVESAATRSRGALQTINGTAIGAAGAVGSIVETYKLAAGDDHDAMPSRWHPVQNPTGRYAHSALSVGFRRTATTDANMFIDPYYRGARSESPTDLGYDRVSVASSVLSMVNSAPEAGIVPYLPTTYTGGTGDGSNKPRLLGAGLKTAPYFMLSAQSDFVIVCKVRLPAGVARGWWPAFWTTTFFWPDYGEIDVIEGVKNAGGTTITAQHNVHASASDGAADSGEAVSTSSVTAARWTTFAVKKEGGTITFYDDVAALGTLASVGSTTTRVARIRGPHDIRLDFAASSAWDSSTFTAGDWPETIEWDYWQAWTPGAGGANSALTILTAVNTTPGGAWTATLPAAATVSGGAAGLEQIIGAYDNYDAPGLPTRDGTTKLPGGMAINTGTRAVTGTVPTTEGGRVGVFIMYAFDDGTPVKRYMLPFNVAPATQSVFASQTPAVSASFSYSVAYTDFHSGNLGPHTYSASSNKAWAVVTLAGNAMSFTVAGTAPGTADTATITINCTNSIGQTTQITRTITATVAAAAYTSWTGPGWFDFSDATSLTLSGSNITGIANKRSGSGDLSYGGTAGKLTTVAAAQNGLAVGRLVRDVTSSAAAPRLLASAVAAISTMCQGNDKPYTVIAVYDPTDTNTGFIWAWSDTVNATDQQNIALIRRNATASSVRRMLTTVSNDVSWGSGQASGAWRVVAVVHSGTAVTVFDNSLTKIVNATSQDVATFNTELVFSLLQAEAPGASDPTYNFSTQCNMDFGEVVVENSARSDADVQQAMTDLATKWGITLT